MSEDRQAAGGQQLPSTQTGAVTFGAHDILDQPAPSQADPLGGTGTALLQAGHVSVPQAYPEGCPTHPAYPGATATIGGAGVRVLRQLFNPNFVIPAP